MKFKDRIEYLNSVHKLNNMNIKFSANEKGNFVIIKGIYKTKF